MLRESKLYVKFTLTINQSNFFSQNKNIIIYWFTADVNIFNKRNIRKIIILFYNKPFVD